jgi:hypothetical protein
MRAAEQWPPITDDQIHWIVADLDARIHAVGPDHPIGRVAGRLRDFWSERQAVRAGAS